MINLFIVTRDLKVTGNSSFNNLSNKTKKILGISSEPIKDISNLKIVIYLIKNYFKKLKDFQYKHCSQF